MDFDSQIFRKLSRRYSTKSDIRMVRRPRISNFYLKKGDKYEYVAYRLTSMKPYFLELLGIEDFSPVNSISSTSFYTYGIIMNPFGHKLDSQNTFIASNIDGSNDVVVKLNLSHLRRYSVFPGQIVAVKGKNITGGEITVETLHCIPVVDINEEKDGKEEKHNQPSIVAFSGPYGFASEFDVLDRILMEEADVLILVGPFISSAHGSEDHSPASMMEKEFVPRIRRWLNERPGSKVVLVPSVNDITCLGVFPQGPIDIDEERIVCTSNPCEFFLNEFLVCVSSLDTPLEISSEECFHDSGLESEDDACGNLLFGGDRLKRIAYHLIFQRTFLPVFPSRNVVSYSVPENMSMDTAPDIYIVVSRLKHFSRDVGPSVVVNLGLQTGKTEKVACHIRLPEAEEPKKFSVEFVDLEISMPRENK
ncbi:DNA polymerase alpha-primase complex subunit B [Encephalitozoon intestinalis ATCC 50506]|uniref:DNA polymerase alpha subunit B n=1 Tax=Encephalitozoon intestinalis (strain ATCC 50506) TaxID=876142 RepID=E0S9P3_ENCIT|nr:DNA polymerase alpha-primase complex subunit B [Encephalitozoon intestinalis ATCC 50506]ADM12428.1 DNA polymerase alpha-primase complex subunit B [Encephalitozoon intestinalis ATCC 50506]UTX46263.1 DNA polymerase alpha subunit B [Encephalitozoon intestinalis]